MLETWAMPQCHKLSCLMLKTTGTAHSANRPEHHHCCPRHPILCGVNLLAPCDILLVGLPAGDAVTDDVEPCHLSPEARPSLYINAPQQLPCFQRCGRGGVCFSSSFVMPLSYI